MALLEFNNKLRSKKVRMIDGEHELDIQQKAKSITMFINADDISETMRPNMADIARAHKPEDTHDQEAKRNNNK